MIQTSRANHRVGLLINLFLRECIEKVSKPWEIKIPKELFDNKKCNIC
jgi:hypothetical protein